jgi:hypothetical protein
VNLLDKLMLPDSDGPCLCGSESPYESCCARDVRRWKSSDLLEPEFLVEDTPVSASEGERWFGYPGVSVRGRLFPPLQRFVDREARDRMSRFEGKPGWAFIEWLVVNLALDEETHEPIYMAWFDAYEDLNHLSEIAVRKIESRGARTSTTYIVDVGSEVDRDDPVVAALETHAHKVWDWKPPGLPLPPHQGEP